MVSWKISINSPLCGLRRERERAKGGQAEEDQTFGWFLLLTKKAEPFESCGDVKYFLFVITIQDLDTLRVTGSLEFLEGDGICIQSTGLMEKIHDGYPIKKTRIE